MNALTRFYFIWLDVGIGGWLVMLVISLMFAWWVIENSQARHLPDGTTWRLLVIAPLSLFIPTLLCGLSVALSPNISLNDAGVLSRPEFQITALLGYGLPASTIVIGAIYITWFWGQEGTLDQRALYNPNRDINPMTGFQIEQLRAAGINHSLEQVELTRLKTGVYADVALMSLDGTEHYRLREGINRIGRRRQNHIFLADRRVSRDHAFIWCNQNHCVLYPYDNDEKVIYVNNRRISKGQSLSDRDLIRFGASPQVYHLLHRGSRI